MQTTKKKNIQKTTTTIVRKARTERRWGVHGQIVRVHSYQKHFFFFSLLLQIRRGSARATRIVGRLHNFSSSFSLFFNSPSALDVLLVLSGFFRSIFASTSRTILLIFMFFHESPSHIFCH